MGQVGQWVLLLILEKPGRDGDLSHLTVVFHNGLQQLDTRDTYDVRGWRAGRAS